MIINKKKVVEIVQKLPFYKENYARMVLDWKIYITEIDISGIKLNSKFSLNRETINYFKNLIASVGFLMPILLDHQNNIIDGQHRYEAYKALGYKTIICIKPNKKYGLSIKKILDE
jgi:hypothetical protein